jgi:plasmid replication initiation protein
MDPGTGDIDISFHRDMFPFLIDLQKHLEEDGHYYTTYKLQNVTLMKHRYSPRIYELLKSYQYNNRKWTFENGTGTEHDLQRRIADTETNKKTREVISIIPDSWKNWAVFKRDVLNPAVKEINKYTDIKVAYVGKKEDIYKRKTRAVRSIEFYMVEKTEPEQRETDGVIDAEYTIIEDEKNYHQLSIEELFFEEHEKSLELERQERELFEAHTKEEKINKSKHPVLYEALTKANFDEEKIDLLYQKAIYGRAPGNVAFKNWELFATDLIIYYFDKIIATPEETKTNTFNRLCDCVENDYSNKSYEFIEKYKK